MLWVAMHFTQLQLDSAGPVDASCHAARIVVNQQRVIQLDQRAYEQGVREGMSVASAAALADHLSISELNPSFEHTRLNELALVAYNFSSDVVVRKCSGTLLLEVSGMLRLFNGSLEEYLSALRCALVSQEVSFDGALATSPLAAERLSCHAPSFSSSSFPQYVRFDASEADSRLARLELGCLDITPALENKLSRLGLKTLADLRALPKAELAMRAGTELVEYLASLAPNASPVLPRFKPPEHFKQSMGFDEEVHTSTALLFPLKRVLRGLEKYLQQRALCTTGLKLHLVHREQTRQTLVVNSAAPEYREELWQGLIRLKLEQFTLSKPVLGMVLEVQNLLGIDGGNSDLFEQGVAPHKLSSVLSRIEAKLGANTVHQASLQADHAPEASYDYVAVNAKQRKAAWQVQEPLRNYADTSLRPSFLFDEPQALGEAVRIIHGPERIQTGWWREQEICRDYFVAMNLDKQLLWVFRDKNQRWFVHGLFA